MFEEPTRDLRTVLAAVSVGVLGLLAGGVLSFGTLRVVSTLVGELPVVAVIVITLVLTQGVAFGGTALAYLRYRGLGGEFVPVRVPSIGDLVWIGGGYLLAFAGVVAGLSIVLYTGAPAASNQVGEIAMENPEVLLLLIPASFLLIGPGEELLFRGIVQGRLRESFGPVVAVVFASAIFASIHFVALTGGAGGRVVTVGVLFLPSLVFGAAYERTGNLAVPALIHGAYNATLFAVAYLALRFGPEAGAAAPAIG